MHAGRHTYGRDLLAWSLVFVFATAFLGTAVATFRLISG